MRYVVGKVDDFADGDRRFVDVAGRSIGIFRADGRFYAVRNRCPHQAGPLCAGALLPWLESSGPGDYRLEEGRWLIACPWHGWEYDLETGQSYFDPAHNRVRAYPVCVAQGEELTDAAIAEAPNGAGRVPGPYTAETFEIDVEDSYVVLEIPGE